VGRDSVLQNLVKDHRVIALDLRGHGKSDKPHDPKAYGTELGQDVIRLLDHLSIARAHIVGYSLGGGISAKLLTTNPDRFVTGIIGGASARRQWTDQDQRNAEARAAELEGPVPYGWMVRLVLMTDQSPLSEEKVRQLSESIAAGNDPMAHAALTRASGQLSVTDTQIARIQVPVLAVVGSADPALANVNALKGIWPALKVIVVDGAVHPPTERGTLRRPEFVASVRDFVAAHRTQTSK
jgi:pimeloyl-ACP methyl ester carboxylesterase